MSEFPSLESLSPTTMTYVVHLEGNIDLESVYELLPLTSITIPTNKKKTKNKKLPFYPENKGKIIATIKYIDNIRGNVEFMPTEGKYLKNSVLTKLGLSDKNVAMGISKNSFHITGVKKYEHVTEALNYMLQYLNDIQDTLNYIQSQPEKVTEIDNWILKNLRAEDDTIKVIDKMPDFLDQKILRFVTSQLWEFNNFDEYYIIFQWMIKCKETITPNLKVINITSTMANYNYDLGFLINRYEMAKRMRDETDFTVIYDNTKAYYIKLELPYVRDESFERIRKKNEVPKHTLMVYKSGKVTQSGPGFEQMKICYDKFRTEILRLRPYIERKKS